MDDKPGRPGSATRGTRHDATGHAGRPTTCRLWSWRDCGASTNRRRWRGGWHGHRRAATCATWSTAPSMARSPRSRWVPASPARSCARCGADPGRREPAGRRVQRGREQLPRHAHRASAARAGAARRGTAGATYCTLRVGARRSGRWVDVMLTDELVLAPPCRTLCVRLRRRSRPSSRSVWSRCWPSSSACWHHDSRSRRSRGCGDDRARVLRSRRGERTTGGPGSAVASRCWPSAAPRRCSPTARVRSLATSPDATCCRVSAHRTTWLTRVRGAHVAVARRQQLFSQHVSPPWAAAVRPAQPSRPRADDRKMTTVVTAAARRAVVRRAPRPMPARIRSHPPRVVRCRR